MGVRGRKKADIYEEQEREEEGEEGDGSLDTPRRETYKRAFTFNVHTSRKHAEEEANM